ncbi:MAG: hypothetical protein PUB73_00645 [Bacteroidales bacterium]|nr:hypothetical protein [Bacteroidales bacterium]
MDLVSTHNVSASEVALMLFKEYFNNIIMMTVDIVRLLPFPVSSDVSMRTRV